MYCTNCGKVLSSTHLFCGFCGQDTHSLKRKSDVMSFGQYKAVKGSQCKERVTKKSKPNEVGVQIGMLDRGGKDFELKPIRNQTILLNIGKTESVDSILEKAVKKYLQFYPKSHDDGASCLEYLKHYKGIHCFLNLFLSHRLSVLLMQIMLQVC
ncbi:unnamed protein product [Clavelina lepadiformis]